MICSMPQPVKDVVNKCIFSYLKDPKIFYLMSGEQIPLRPWYYHYMVTQKYVRPSKVSSAFGVFKTFD